MNDKSGKAPFGHWSVLLLIVYLWAACFIVSGAAPSGSAFQGKDGPELQQALNTMEEVAAKFHDFKAKFSQKRYTAILKEFDSPDMGEFFYAYAADRSILMRHEITNPGRRILTIKGDLATLYQPLTKEAKIYRLGNYKGLLEYLYLGMGQHPDKLKEKYHVAYQGSESINGSACSILVFKPKDAKAAASIASITIWLKKASGISLQYKLQEPHGDYLLVSFFDEKLNSKVSGSKFEQKLPKDVEIQKF
jgi:outer membrane lipoprotein-sorting protein